MADQHCTKFRVALIMGIWGDSLTRRYTVEIDRVFLCKCDRRRIKIVKWVRISEVLLPLEQITQFNQRKCTCSTLDVHWYSEFQDWITDGSRKPKGPTLAVCQSVWEIWLNANLFGKCNINWRDKSLPAVIFWQKAQYTVIWACPYLSLLKSLQMPCKQVTMKYMHGVLIYRMHCSSSGGG